MKKKIAIIVLVIATSILTSCGDPSGDELFENVELKNIESTGGNGGAGDDPNDPPPPPPAN